ncbi:MAG: phosphoribosyl-AMP cyclohydrolase [Alphaproteobacteria bacterium]
MLKHMLHEVKFDEKGLVAAIAQEEGSGLILMMAWMNAEALSETLRTGQVTYFSRSRQALWRKGESSGQTQELIDANLDCDGDAIVFTVKQNGVACHTGRKSCFYRRFDMETEILVETSKPEIDPSDLYKT